MSNYIIMTNSDLMETDGGCTWCKVGQSLITVGGIIATGCNPVSLTIGGIALIATWAC